jgi:disulfide bond formation protein DsbB
MTPLLARAPLLLLLASGAILGMALASQYWGGLAPCELCYWQRWAYVTAMAPALLAMFAPGRARAVLLGLAALVFLGGAGIAFFHVGVEQKWWAGLSGCGVTGGADSIEALKAQIMAAPVVRCDDIAFQLFGISMAGWNVLASVLLAGFAALAARVTWQKG